MLFPFSVSTTSVRALTPTGSESGNPDLPMVQAQRL
jgi:hypothetical protein